MGDRTRGHRLCVGATTSFIAPWCNNRGGKAAALAGAIKRGSKHEFMHHLDSSHNAPSTSRDMTTISKMGPMITEGPAMLRVLW
jgi:hypothetical protein